MNQNRFANLSAAAVAEASVVGSLLLDGNIIRELVLKIRPEDFALDESRAIFRAASALFSEGKTIDPVAVLHKLPAFLGKKVTEQQARQFMFECIDVTPTAAHWSEYTQILQEQSRLRQLREIAQELAQVQTTETALQLVGQASEILGQNTRAKYVTMPEADDEFRVRMHEKRDSIDWGIDRLNQSLYSKYGDFVILAGRPSDGKTALALQMAFTMAKTDRVGFFSLETSSGTLTDRLHANYSLVSLATINQRDLSEDDWKQIDHGSERIRKAKLEWIEAAGFTVQEIFAMARARQYKIIFIDYIQKIHPSDAKSSRFETVTSVSLALQDMATIFGILTVGLSQFSRAAAHGTPDMSYLRESGQLEQDADVVLALSRASDEESNMEGDRKLSILKNKKGTAGNSGDSFIINFDGAHQRFIEYLPEDF